MDIRPLEELREPDERTLAFSPQGFGVQMRPEDSADFLQRIMARHELAPAVAEGTRRSFDQLREIFAYGLLSYPIFTIVAEHALLVFEQALRHRFIEFHQGAVTFADPKTGQEETVAASSYEDVADFIKCHRGWKLRIGAGPDTIPFNGMLDGLHTWARRTGLLRGQRNRGTEDAISRLRNYAAHPSDYHLTTLTDAAGTMSDLAEIINQLWGSATPRGRLYPVPVQRTIIRVSWNRQTGETAFWPVSGGPVARRQSGMAAVGGTDAGAGDMERDWQHILVRGVPDDWDLMHFDARYQTGRYPAEWLWGPGNEEEASAWLDAEKPQDDELDILDRLFLLRYYDNLLYLARSADQAASVTAEEKPGVWYVVRADSPDDAFNHQREQLVQGSRCAGRGPCLQHPVQTLGNGSWYKAMDIVATAGVTPTTINVPDVCVPPSLSRRPRSRRYLGDGNWDIPAD
jgi:hypothetical protein